MARDSSTEPTGIGAPGRAHARRGGCPRGSRADQGGLALIEVLASSIVLAIAVVGLALMFSEGHSHVVADGDDRAALALAQHKIEAVRGMGFACIPLQATPATPNTPVAGVSGCADDAAAQAVRTFNETPPIGCNPVAAECRYTSRVTLVECASPADLQVVSPCPAPVTGKKITVQVTPAMAKARALQVETFMAVH